MGESILNSVKKMIGPEEDYTHFDPQLIIHINSVLSTLSQLGVGPEDGFAISDASDTWEDLIADDKLLNLVKTYVYIKVRLVFDPPTVGGILESMEREANRLEWRINHAAETHN